MGRAQDLQRDLAWAVALVPVSSVLGLAGARVFADPPRAFGFVQEVWSSSLVADALFVSLSIVATLGSCAVARSLARKGHWMRAATVASGVALASHSLGYTLAFMTLDMWFLPFLGGSLGVLNSFAFVAGWGGAGLATCAVVPLQALPWRTVLRARPPTSALRGPASPSAWTSITEVTPVTYQRVVLRDEPPKPTLLRRLARPLRTLSATAKASVKPGLAVGAGVALAGATWAAVMVYSSAMWLALGTEGGRALLLAAVPAGIAAGLAGLAWGAWRLAVRHDGPSAREGSTAASTGAVL